MQHNGFFLVLTIFFSVTVPICMLDSSCFVNSLSACPRKYDIWDNVVSVCDPQSVSADSQVFCETMKSIPIVFQCSHFYTGNTHIRYISVSLSKSGIQLCILLHFPFQAPSWSLYDSLLICAKFLVVY